MNVNVVHTLVYKTHKALVSATFPFEALETRPSTCIIIRNTMDSDSDRYVTTGSLVAEDTQNVSVGKFPYLFIFIFSIDVFMSIIVIYTLFFVYSVILSYV